MIAEAQNPVAFRCQIRISLSVARDTLRFIVLPTVDLDDKARGLADKIDDEGPDRLLPAKACTIQPMSAQLFPDRTFGICHIAA